VVRSAAARFDERIEQKAKAGRLDRLAEQAIADFRADRARVVRHFASPSFWKAYAKLSESVGALAEKGISAIRNLPGFSCYRHRSVFF
jgi:hypothetical protein